MEKTVFSPCLVPMARGVRTGEVLKKRKFIASKIN